MSGITLMFSGIVLISNALNYLDRVDDNSNAMINIFTGSLYILLNVWYCMAGVWHQAEPTYYYGAISGLLFGYTYLSYGVNRVFNWDNRNLGYFSLFVFINSLFFAYMVFFQGAGNVFDGLSWLIWGLLWLTNYLAHNMGMVFGNWLHWSSLIAGIITCWIPGLMILTGTWP